MKPKMQPLYEIASEYLKVYDELMNIPDLPQEVINDTLESIAAPLENKAINVAAFIKNLEAEAKAIEMAEKNMYERRKKIDKKTKNLRNYLKFNLLQCHTQTIKSSPMFTIILKNSPPSLIIENQKDIPSKYIDVEVVEKINNKDVKKALINGEIVPGARLEINKSLIIK